MSRASDRRTFLRTLGRAGLAAPVLPLVGACVPDAPPGRGTGEGGAGDRGGPAAGSASGPAVLTHPILRLGPDDTVHLVAPLRELPMAYVSTGLQQIFVDYDYRDRARFTLDAHISVSTGLWRIHLPGDDPDNRFVVPGDEPREFEELDIARWEPTMVPAEGDFRLVRGSPRPLRIDFDCIAVPGGRAWVSGGPWEVLRCDGVGDEMCREDFIEVGVGVRGPVRGCADAGTPTRVLTWARLT